MAKVSDFQNLSKEELVEKEGQLKKQLMQLRFDAKLGKLEKHSTVKEMRRDIARVLTVMNQKPVVAKAAPVVAVAAKVKSKAKVKNSRSAS